MVKKKACCDACRTGHKCIDKKMAKIGKGISVKRGKESQLRKKPGGSNVGKYKKVKKGNFCGPSGGAPSGSYPVNTKKRARAALAYAHNAPNPSGIKKCVARHYPKMGKKGKK